MTHPHDFALLNDALDGRLAPAAREELERRLADEPALAAAHAELVRMRAAVRDLEAARTAPPDFLARVRTRAGVPAPEPAVAAPAHVRDGPALDAAARAAPGTAAAPAAAADGLSGTGGLPGARAGRLRAWRVVALPIAAGTVVALAASWFFTLRRAEVAPAGMTARADGRDGAASDGPRAALEAAGADKAARAEATAADALAREVGAPGAGGEPAPSPSLPGSPVPGDPRNGGGGGGAATPGPFRNPGGAVRPGLRSPTDAPGAPPPAARPPAVPVAPPATSPRTPEDVTAGDAPTPSGGAPEARPSAPVGPPSGPFGARGRAPRRADAPASTHETQDADAADDGRPQAGSWAADGVDDVLVLRAASVDEARARVALWLVDPASADDVLELASAPVPDAAPTANAAPAGGTGTTSDDEKVRDPSAVGRAADGRTADGRAADGGAAPGAARDAGATAPDGPGRGAGAPESAKKAAEAGAPGVLGSFLVDVPTEPVERLRARAFHRVTARRAEPGTPGRPTAGPPASPPPQVPSEAEPSKDASGAPKGPVVPAPPPTGAPTAGKAEPGTPDAGSPPTASGGEDPATTAAPALPTGVRRVRVIVLPPAR